MLSLYTKNTQLSCTWNPCFIFEIEFSIHFPYPRIKKTDMRVYKTILLYNLISDPLKIISIKIIKHCAH